MSEIVDTSPRGSYAFRIAFVAAIGGFLFGFDLGMVGAANVYLRDQFHLSDAQFGFATASAVWSVFSALFWVRGCAMRSGVSAP